MSNILKINENEIGSVCLFRLYSYVAKTCCEYLCLHTQPPLSKSLPSLSMETFIATAVLVLCKAPLVATNI